MQPLYKRLLLTLFPDEMKHADINPATMFISSLSTKEFFSLLSRKVTEYYKINGFDTGLETFEAKIGMGNEQGISVEKANDYYGYLISAQYSGKGFFSPTFVGTHITLYSATLLAPYLREYGDDALIHTMVMMYIMPLLFVTHIKQFPPEMSPKEQYNRFVKLCQSTLDFVIDDEDKKLIQTIILALNQESTVLRNLVQICKQAENVFPLGQSPKEYWKRMFDEHLFDHDEAYLKDFLQHYTQASQIHTYETYEEEALSLLLPSEFSVSSLYANISIFDVVQHIIRPRYASSTSLDEHWISLTDEPERRPTILREFQEITYAKKAFWGGVHQFISYLRTTNENDIDEDIDEFMSAIEDGSQIDPDAVPESIKRESRTIDQIVHFYVGLIGCHRNAKNDNFWYRWTGEVPSVQTHRDSLIATDSTYRKHHLSLYDTNGFYYQKARDHIRQGKQRFHIPLRALLHYNTDDLYTREQITLSSLLHLVDDTLPTRTKLVLHHQNIIQLFDKMYVSRIRERIADEEQLLGQYWGLIDSFVGGSYSDIYGSLTNHPARHESLIDSFYRLDQHIWYDVLSAIVNDSELTALLQSFYSDTTLIVLLSEIKKTIFGLMLRMTYGKDHHISQGTGLLLFYLREVLHLEPAVRKELEDIILSLLDRHYEILSPWTNIDDNPTFLAMCDDMRQHFLRLENYNLTPEDVLRLHSTLHHLSAYNVRYVIPD